MRNLFLYMRDNPVKFSFQEQFYNSPNISMESREAGLSYYAPLFKLFRRGIEHEIIKNYPRKLIGAFITEPILSLVRAHCNKELDVTDDILEKAIEMAWQAIKV